MEDLLFMPEEETSITERYLRIDIGGSSTKTYDRIECESYDILVHGSSTVMIGELICTGGGKIRVANASTLKISSMVQTKKDTNLDVSGSSTLIFKGGAIKRAKGLIQGASTGICDCTCLYTNEVEVQGPAVWKSREPSAKF